jgi:hypothetical protein
MLEARAISTYILNKTRPSEFKGREYDAYFTLLERIVSQLELSSATTGGSTSAAPLAIFQGKLDEFLSLTDGPLLTADCASMTADNDYLTADIG